MEQIIKNFEELTTTELYEILKVRAEVFVVEQECVYNDIDEKDKAAIHIILQENTGIVAYARVLPVGVKFEKEVSIGRVLTKARGTGLGKRLMETAIATAQEKLNAKSIRIEAQAHATGFYEKVGFVVDSQEFLEDDILHVEMIWRG